MISFRAEETEVEMCSNQEDTGEKERQRGVSDGRERGRGDIPPLDNISLNILSGVRRGREYKV